jgi:NADH:ubiquinone oxidoreductase subunit 5 (subunit L)/multisubunit Na+/H+ antiporter MnhA subunit
MLIGLATAYYMYLRAPETPARIAARHPFLYRFLLNKWYFDELYDLVFRAALHASRPLPVRTGDVRRSTGSGPTASRPACSTSRAAWSACRRLRLPLCLRDADRRRGDRDLVPVRRGPLMFGFGILSGLLILPLVGAAFILTLRGDGEAVRSNVRWAALATTVITFLVSLVAWARFDISTAEFQLVESHAWLTETIRFKLGVDGFSLPFVILTTFLMPFCILASWESIGHRVKEYFVAFLVLEAMVIGVFTALDLFLFYVFFEAGLIPMFLIIGVWGGKRRIYAAFKFFLYTLLGSLLMLIAMIAMYFTAGTTDIPTLLQTKFASNLSTGSGSPSSPPSR